MIQIQITKFTNILLFLQEFGAEPPISPKTTGNKSGVKRKETNQNPTATKAKKATASKVTAIKE